MSLTEAVERVLTPNPEPPEKQRRRKGRIQHTTQRNRQDSWRPRWAWGALTIPGGAWLALLILAPFYVVLCVAFGTLDPFFQSPVPVWNPAQWNGSTFVQLWHEVIGHDAFLLPPMLRTLWYTAAAAVISLLIGYPVAYFVARHGGRRKSFYLVLLVAPFWISYMMRMLAWIDLLQTNGYINRVLEDLGIMSRSHPYAWIGGKSITVILGLVYGYIPYLIVVLYAGLDRIDPRLLEASQDLGLSKWKTFWKVTMPLSRATILAGAFITVLPMLGDFFTNQLLSASPSTTMIGNEIQGQLAVPNLEQTGAALSMVLLVVLLVPMLYYVRATARQSAENV